MGIKQPNKQTIIFAFQIFFSDMLDSHVALSDKDDLARLEIRALSSSSTLSKKVKDLFIK